MMSQRAQVIAAIASVLGLVAAILWVTHEPEQAAARDAGGRARGASHGDVLTAADVPALQHLYRPPTPPPANERNRDLFAYAESPAEKDARDKAAAEAAEAARQAAELAARQAAERAEQERLRRELEAERLRQQATAAAAAAASQPAAPPPPPDPPSFPYRFIGLIGPRADAWAILEDSDKNFLYAKAGDVLDSAFRVSHVGAFALHLGYTDQQFAGRVGQVPRTFAAEKGAAGGGAARKPAQSRGRR